MKSVVCRPSHQHVTCYATFVVAAKQGQPPVGFWDKKVHTHHINGERMLC